jgi:hypothetical protein
MERIQAVESFFSRLLKNTKNNNIAIWMNDFFHVFDILNIFFDLAFYC